jgi:hypothetical protein
MVLQSRGLGMHVTTVPPRAWVVGELLTRLFVWLSPRQVLHAREMLLSRTLLSGEVRALVQHPCVPGRDRALLGFLWPKLIRAQRLMPTHALPPSLEALGCG